MKTASETAPAAQESLESGADSPLKAQRLRRELTRRDLAALADISVSALTGIENGHQRPSLTTAQRLADCLAVDLEDVFRVTDCACGCGGHLIDLDRHGGSARFLSGHNSQEPDHGASVARAHKARRARLGIPEEKTCQRCGRVFTRSEIPNQSLAHWLARRYCEGSCRWDEIKARERDCEHCGQPIPQKVMARNWRRRFCTYRCGQLARWGRLSDIPDSALRALPPKARQIYFGRKKGRAATGGGRPLVSVSEEKRTEIEKLANQGWGRRGDRHKTARERASRAQRSRRDRLAPLRRGFVPLVRP